MGKWIITVITLLSLHVRAQEQSNAQVQGTNGSQEESSMENKPAPLTTADTPGAAEAAAMANEDNASASHNAAVEPPTASTSGSPAVLAPRNGTGADGTNTIQRASMNMAGAPAANLNLDDQQAVNVDSELRDRQEATRATEGAAANQRAENDTTSGDAGDINEKNRRENNARSDQNLSSKEKAPSARDGNDTKKEKRSKRKRTPG